MKKIFTFSFLLFIVALLYYFALPNPEFPKPPSDSVQSDEPADIETPLRRAYFTNFTRDQVINHYKNQYSNLPFIRLNYPPEESQNIIRDQTRSTYLEELVHPLRESIYVNGFEPKSEKDTIIINGKPWRQKIIVRQVNSTFYIRVSVLVLILALGLALMREYTYDKKS